MLTGRMFDIGLKNTLKRLEFDKSVGSIQDDIYKKEPVHPHCLQSSE